MKKTSRQAVFRKLGTLYEDMVASYEDVANTLGHTCKGCAKNCCTSYFQHHTYVEWAYLWKGLKELPEAKREEYARRAREYVRDAQGAMAAGRTPSGMCPLNDDGLCGLYRHRLMICRMHGVPNMLVRPDGRKIAFPGCWLSQEITEKMDPASVPYVDRTPHYRRLVELEREFLGNKMGKLPKVDLTLAEMIVLGPPSLTR